jgi:hypothetical protein
MPLTRMRFDIVGDVQYSRAFHTMGREAADMTDPLTEIGESLRLSVSEQFRTEGRHGLGVGWQALDAAYARWKASAVGEQPILVFRGDMRDAMLSRSAFTISPRRLVYEPDDPKAYYHQVGEGNLPAREMVALNEAERRGWDRIFASWLNGLRHGPLGALA